MKKNLLAICVSVAAFSLSACSDNDKEYYLNHISEAESKLQQCNADAKEALQNKDRDALNKIKQDVECQAASAAVKEHRTAEAKRQREEEQAKRQAALDEAKKKLNDEFGDLDWRAFTNKFLKHQCVINYNNNRDNPECPALYALQHEKEEQGNAEMMKLPLDEILVAQKEACSTGIFGTHTICHIIGTAGVKKAAEDAAKMTLAELATVVDEYNAPDHPRNLLRFSFKREYDKKSKEYVDYLKGDYERIKTAYNQCVDLVAAIPENDAQTKRKLLSTYPCAQAVDAARGVTHAGGLSKKME